MTLFFKDGESELDESLLRGETVLMGKVTPAEFVKVLLLVGVLGWPEGSGTALRLTEW